MKGEVIIKPAPKPYFPDGVNIFVKYNQGKEVLIAWLAELSTHCVC